MTQQLVAPSLVDSLLALPAEHLRYVVANLSEEERIVAWRQLTEMEANPYFKWRGNILGFVEQELGESVWSKQREIYEAMAEHPKVVVAACHAPGKSHVASRAIGAVAVTWPADMVRVMTTATNFRQVKGILWPYINRLHKKYDLPGVVHTTSWKIGDEEVGTGFSARHQDEAAVQGWHATGELLLVVDEAGGIHRKLGDNFTSILSGNAHALVIGNPPTDEEGTWFQRIHESEEWHSITISAYDTPNFTAEIVGRCTICPPTIEWHTIAKHLTDRAWVEGVRREFGVESAYYQARVLARFPRNVVSKTLPMSWLEAAIAAAKATPVTVAPMRLGVDVASDGGDELVIARAIGWRAKVIRTAVGPMLQNSVDVAGIVLEEIDAAEEYHKLHGITERVKVKVDKIGVGWGVVSQLEKWRKEKRHTAEIIEVVSSRRAHKTLKFRNQRSEMWWTMRELLQPVSDGESGVTEGGLLELEIDADDLRTLAQLNAPKYATSSTGQTVVQPKPEVKSDTGHSPDRADALLLALYEPPVRRLPTTPGIAVSQTNYWGAISS